MVRQSVLLFLALGLICFHLGNSKIYAQGQRKTGSIASQQSQDPLLRSLLEEVRQLRLAFERANFNVFRAQIIVERIRLQQELIARLHQQLEEVRGQLADNKLNQSHLEEDVKELNSKINQEREPKKLEEYESQLKAMKDMLEQQRVWEDRETNHENTLKDQIRTAQDKLKGLNDRLDTLENEIEVRSAPNSKP